MKKLVRQTDIQNRGTVQGDDELAMSLKISNVETRTRITKESRFKLKAKSHFF